MKYASGNIHITIVERFENNDLVIDGYDIGKTVVESSDRRGWRTC